VVAPPPFPTAVVQPVADVAPVLGGDQHAGPASLVPTGYPLRPTPWYPRPLARRRSWVPLVLLVVWLVVAGGLTAYYGRPAAVAWWQQRQLELQVDSLTATAAAHLQAGRHADADQSARQALELLPNHAPARQIIDTAASQRAILLQREKNAAAALAAAEKLAADDDLPAAIKAFGAICQNPATPAAIVNQADQRRHELRAATGTLVLPPDWPDDAILRLDGELQTPGIRTITGIPFGKHTVKVTRQGHRPPPPIKLEFRGSRPVPLPSIAWELVGGTVVVTSEPPGAAVWHEGKDTGRTTPCTFQDVNVGKISYLLKLPGHLEATAEGEVATAATLELSAALPLLPRFPVAGKQAGERQEFNLTPSLRVPFRWCPPGSFTMGGTDVAATPAEKPVRTVKLTQGFWLGETEFTQGQWQALTGLTLFGQATGGSRHIGRGPDHPMYFVTWDQLCGNNTRSGGELAKINAYLRQHGGGGWTADLPTETQWEYACRAGTTTPFGTREAGLDGFNRSAWHRDNSGLVAHPVGTKDANPWGLKDLHGNVAEWCRDWYQDNYAKLPASDPLGPASGWKVVVRGGSCQNPPALCRAAARGQAFQSTSSALVGFRLVLRPPDPTPGPVVEPPKPPAKKPPAKPPVKRPPPKPNKPKK
jgi:formylglycine-generating enzyme required for sulfatase activity